MTPTDFSLDDVTSTDGSLSNLSGSGTTYTATFDHAHGGCAVLNPGIRRETPTNMIWTKDARLT
jgi:hypothetical protein